MNCRRVLLLAIAATLAAAPRAWCATWSHVGTSGFYMGDGSLYDQYETLAEHYLTDANRIKMASMVVDFAGNVFAVCNDNENYATDEDGGVTIFKADGSVVNANVRAQGYSGGITKLVLAGDGMVYAAQNYVEINWPDGTRGREHKILRINSNGQVDLIWSAAWANSGDASRDIIRGMSVGPGGYVYWAMNGASPYWRYHLLWRYNWRRGRVEPAPTDGHLNGNSNPTGLCQFAYVGGDWFALTSVATSPIYAVRYLDAIGWNADRREAQNRLAASWACDRTTALAYDPRFRKLWIGPRGTTDPSNRYTAIMARFNGSSANPGLFTATVDSPKSGIVDDTTADPDSNASVWHMNGNNPQDPPTGTGHSNGGKYWCNALAINPADGTAWMSWGGDKCLTCTPPNGPYDYTGYGPYGQLGAVYTVTRDGYGPSGNEGTPQATSPRPSWVMALAFGERGGQCCVFALTCDMNDGRYDLYQAPVVCPPVGACCQRDNVCSQETLDACMALGGEYQGDGVSCAQAQCNVVGACCQEKGVCTQEMRVDCEAPNTFQGEGVPCEAVDCRYQVCQTPAADADGDGDVDSADFAIWQRCLSGDDDISEFPIKCSCLDSNLDGHISGDDLQLFLNCGSGPGVPVQPGCDSK